MINTNLPIVGIHPFTATDFPGRIAAIFFLGGCPFTCKYCHNSSIAWNKDWTSKVEQVNAFLETHQNFLDGVVLSGGEPTQYGDIERLCVKIQAMGLQVALHTNGYYPDTLSKLINGSLVNYLAMDVKAPAYKYETITGRSNSAERATESIKQIIQYGIEYEFRTTYHPDLLTHKDMFLLMDELYTLGATTYYIQRFQPTGVEDINLVKRGQNVKIPADICEYGKKLFPTFGIR